jgi:YtcA family
LIRILFVTSVKPLPRTDHDRAAALLFLASVSLTGCSDAGAPSFVVFGAFFPAWMLFASVGIVGAIVARAIIVSSDMSNTLPHRLLVCTAIGTISAIAAWFLCFGW